MLNSLKLFLLVTLITVGSVIIDNSLFSNVEGGTLLELVGIIGVGGMGISFIAVLIEIHHEAIRRNKVI